MRRERFTVSMLVNNSQCIPGGQLTCVVHRCLCTDQVFMFDINGSVHTQFFPHLFKVYDYLPCRRLGIYHGYRYNEAFSPRGDLC